MKVKMTMVFVSNLLLFLYALAIPSEALNGYALVLGLLTLFSGFCAGMLSQSKD